MNVRTATLIVLLVPVLLFAKDIPPRSIKLENKILLAIDGNSLGFNGENVALTKKYQSQILDILLGTRTKNGRVGCYEFEGKKYNVQQLREIEVELGSHATPTQKQEFQQALKHLRADFEKISEIFRDQAKAAKSMMGELIEESCKKRDRDNCLLLVWAKSKEEEEKLFDQHVKSIRDFEIFMTDLYNFLSDLVTSCPIAEKQFHEKAAKFNKIQKLLPALGIPEKQQQLFMKYVQKHLNTITLNDIDENKLKELYKSFK